MTPNSKILKEILSKLLEKKNREALERILERVHAGDLFVVFRALSHSERIELFKILIDINLNKAMDIFYDLDEDIQIEILRNLKISQALLILLNLSTGELSRIIDKLPKNLQIELLNRLEEEDRKELEKIISYGEDNIAPLISEDYIAVQEDKTVEDALNIVKTSPDDIEIIYIYVVDEKNHIVGVVSVKELLTAPSNAIIKDVANSNVIVISDISTKEEAIEIFQRYDLFILPVVKHGEGILIGVIYIDDILDTLVEKTSESIFKLAGSREEELFYSNQVFKIVKLRSKWLTFSILFELIASFIIITFSKIFFKIDFFNEENREFVLVRDFIIILSFIPLLAAMTGNISSQASLILTRGILTGRLKENFKDFINFLFREVKVAFIFAFLTSTFVSLFAYIIYPHDLLSFIVGLALFINMLLAAIFGGLLPFIAYKLKKEPTYFSSPLILTINDIFAILIYLTIAYYLLKETSL